MGLFKVFDWLNLLLHPQAVTIPLVMRPGDFTNMKGLEMDSLLINECLSKAREDLKNFPDEVFEDWIAPIVRSSGWPLRDIENGLQLTCSEVLWGKDVGYWSNLKWHMLRVPFGVIRFDSDSQMRSEIIERDALDLPHGGILPTFDDGWDRGSSKIRFKFAHDFIMANGRFPKPIVGVMQNDATFRIADGHHRYAAALCALYQKVTIEIDAWVAFSPQ